MLKEDCTCSPLDCEPTDDLVIRKKPAPTHFLILLVVPALLLVSAWLWQSRPGITVDNFKTIRPGMTIAAVEGVLGGPPRNEVTGGQHEADGILLAAQPESAAEHLWSVHDWKSDALHGRIWFDANGRVIEVWAALHEEGPVHSVWRLGTPTAKHVC